MQATRELPHLSLIVAGTGSSKDRSTSVTSDIGKQVKNVLADAFPLATKQEVLSILTESLKVSEEQVLASPQAKYLFDARHRLVARTVEEYFGMPASLTAVVRLTNAISISVSFHQDRLHDSILERVRGPSDAASNTYLELLHAVYIGAELTNGQMSFGVSENDLCAIGLGGMTGDQGIVRVSEKFAIDVIKRVFMKDDGALASRVGFEKSVQDLQRLVNTLGRLTTTKGNMWERVVFSLLCDKRLQKVNVLRLPFVQLAQDELKALSKVWGKVAFKCDGIATLAEASCTTEAEFLQRHSGRLLSPGNLHRADAIDKLAPARLFEASFKLYSSPVSSNKTLSQFRSTNPSAAYEHADVLIQNPQAASLRKAWEDAKLHQALALRMHVTLPKCEVPAEYDEEVFVAGTHVMEDKSIVVNLDWSNLYLLVGAPSSEDDPRAALYRLLRHVIGLKDIPRGPPAPPPKSSTVGVRRSPRTKSF